MGLIRFAVDDADHVADFTAVGFETVIPLPPPACSVGLVKVRNDGVVIDRVAVPIASAARVRSLPVGTFASTGSWLGCRVTGEQPADTVDFMRRRTHVRPQQRFDARVNLRRCRD
jgi:hypothetical protein